MARPSYADALDAVCDGISDANKFTVLHEYVTVLIASIVGDLYDMETQNVLSDIRARVSISRRR